MKKIEKLRKLIKYTQWAGIAFVVLVAIAMIVLQNKINSDDNMIFMFSLVGLMVLFVAVSFITIPIQHKLQNTVILESLNGLVDDVQFESKKGYSKESFSYLAIAPENYNQYGCSDYYRFKYHNMIIDSVTCKACNEIKISKSVDSKGKKVKAHKEQKIYFYGRLYIIPLKSGLKFNVMGKSLPSLSRKKDALRTTMTNEISLKVKKHAENFEVYYGEEKPNINMQKFIDKVLTLKLQAKGPVHVYVRDNNLILLLDNNRFYQEIDVKKPVDESIIKGYRRDVSMVLNFISSICDSNNELSAEFKEN